MSKKNNKLETTENVEVVNANETQNEQKVEKADKKQNNEQKNKKAKKQNNEPKHNKVKETVAELKKVTWPSFGEVVKNTLVVLGIVVVCTLALFAIDRVLSWIYQLMVDGAVTNWL